MCSGWFELASGLLVILSLRVIKHTKLQEAYDGSYYSMLHVHIHAKWVHYLLSSIKGGLRKVDQLIIMVDSVAEVTGLTKVVVVAFAFLKKSLAPFLSLPLSDGDD